MLFTVKKWPKIDGSAFQKWSDWWR